MGPFDELKVFTGNAHPQLAGEVCAYLNIPIGQAEVFKFSNDNTFVRILENVRQRGRLYHSADVQTGQRQPDGNC